MSTRSKSCSWLEGPQWLKAPTESWPTTCDIAHAPAVETSASCLLTRGSNEVNFDHLSKFSDLNRLLRHLVRLRRWIRFRLGRETTSRVLQPMTREELDIAFAACVRYSQERSFQSDMARLAKSEPVSSKRSLATLDPFLCPQGVLRVGGRLHFAALSFDRRHPPILEASCPLAGLIIRWAHIRSLHGGFRVTFTQAMQRAWLIRGSRHVRRYVRQCLVCVAYRARPANQMMASLPPERVTPCRAFERTGLDYAGPFAVSPSRGRGIRVAKA
ncbi:hypothetical protein TKK_0012567 [Trichogramma kaykai]